MAIGHEVMTVVHQTWIGEASGPLILMPECLLTEWSGIDVPDYRSVVAQFRWNAKEPRACDYDRACDVSAPAGVIPVAFGQGLVLSESLLPTTWLPRPWGGLLARWNYADSNDARDGALARVPEALAWEATEEFTVVDSPLTLFNSAEPGLDPVYPRLTIPSVAGPYRVRWAQYEPDDRTAFRIVELRSAAI
jgi:hypothetical protein